MTEHNAIHMQGWGSTTVIACWAAKMACESDIMQGGKNPRKADLSKDSSHSKAHHNKGHDPGRKLHGKEAPVDPLAFAPLSQAHPNDGPCDALAAGHRQPIPARSHQLTRLHICIAGCTAASMEAQPNLTTCAEVLVLLQEHACGRMH